MYLKLSIANESHFTQLKENLKQKLGDNCGDLDITFFNIIIDSYFNQSNLDIYMYPIIEDTVCSIKYSNSAKNFTFEGEKIQAFNLASLEDYTNIIKAEFNKYYKFKSSEKINKYITCFLLFLFKNIKCEFTNNISISLYDYVYEKYDYIINNIYNNELHDIISKIVDILMRFSKTQDPDLKFELQELLDTNLKSQLSEDVLRKRFDIVYKINERKINEILLRDLTLDPITKEIKEEHCPFTLYQYLFKDSGKTEANYLEDLNIPKAKLENIIREKLPNESNSELKTILEKYNPDKCTVVKEDLFLMTEFRDYTLDDIDKFINIGDIGYCFTYDYLIYSMIDKLGLPDIKGASIKSEELLDALVTYYNSSDNETKKNINTLLISKSIVQENNQFDIKDIFTKLLNGSFKEEKIEESVHELLKYSCGSIFDLIGLFGFTLFSDDITQFDNKADLFWISRYCIEIFSDFIKEIQNIKITENVSLFDFLTNIDTNIKTLFNDLGSTCIHGIGNKCLEFYIKTLKYRESYKSKLINEDTENITLKNWGLNLENKEYTKKIFVEDILKIPPFLYRAPEYLKKHGIAYITCIKFETDKIQKEDVYAIKGYSESGKLFKIATFYSGQYDMDNIFIKKTDMIITPATTDLELFKSFHTNINLDFGLLKDLLSISYKFQKHRVPMFKVFKEYTLNLCSILTGPNPQNRYDTLKTMKDNKYMNLETLEENIIPIKYLCAVEIDQSTSYHMYANSQSEQFNKTKKYYITYLDQLVKLEYQPHSEKEEPIIQNPENRTDITRGYLYSKLLEYMLYDNLSLNPNIHKKYGKVVTFKFAEYVQEEYSKFENYYLKLNGQSTNFRNGLFSNLTIEINTETIHKNEFSKLKYSTKLKELAAGDPNKLEALIKIFDYLSAIDAINGPIILHNITIEMLNQPANIYKFLRDIFEKLLVNIIKRLRCFMSLIISYYSVILPSNKLDNSYRWQIDELTDINNNFTKIWLNEDLLKYNIFFIKKYYDILNDLLLYITKYGNTFMTFVYHFTELDREIYLLKYFGKDLTKLQENVKNFFKYYDDTKYYHEILEKPNDFTLLKNERQEGDNLYNEYLTKCKLLETHKQAMFEFNHFENILLYYINNMTDPNYITTLYQNLEVHKNLQKHRSLMAKIFEKLQDKYFESLNNQQTGGSLDTPQPSSIVLTKELQELYENLEENLDGRAKLYFNTIKKYSNQPTLSKLQEELSIMIKNNTYNRKRINDIEAYLIAINVLSLPLKT